VIHTKWHFFQKWPSGIGPPYGHFYPPFNIFPAIISTVAKHGHWYRGYPMAKNVMHTAIAMMAIGEILALKDR
jgi:hypothetical protein